QGVWDHFYGDERAIEQFVSALLESTLEAARAEIFQMWHDRISREMEEVKEAVNVLLRHCDTRKAPSPSLPVADPEQFAERFPGIEATLQNLAVDSGSYFERQQEGLAMKIPTSRKSRLKFLRRVHAPYLFVEQVRRLFGQPH